MNLVEAFSVVVVCPAVLISSLYASFNASSLSWSSLVTTVLLPSLMVLAFMLLNYQGKENMFKAATGCQWYQGVVTLKPKNRGCHLVTEEVVKATPEIKNISIGLLNMCIQHTSASIYLNENWDSDVRVDTEMVLNHVIPEKMPYKHTCEGPDDMPAHVKAAFIGSTLSIPITDGKLNLGTWQGIWMCEHRNRASSRHIVMTIQGALQKDDL